MTGVIEKSHSELGASIAPRWMACPGSVQLTRTVPPAPTTEYAREGTAAHALAELSLRKDIDPETYIGVELEGVEVTDEMAAAVKVYVDYCQECKKVALPDALTWIEYQFTLSALNPPGPMFGTADFVIYDIRAGVIEVVDFKYGQGVVVEAKDNRQLRYYALGATLSVGKDRHINRIKMTIVQPRAMHLDGVVRSDVIYIDELIGFSRELIEAARATQAPDAPLVPGRHCRFCPAAGVCSALNQQSQEIAMVEFAEMPLDQPRAPATLTDAELANVLHLLPMLEDWAAAVRAHAQAKLERGEEVAGFKLVAKRANRSWVDEQETKQWLLAQPTLHPDEYMVTKLKSPAQIEKLVGKKNLPADLTQKVSSGTTLVPDTDPRPAVVLTAGHEFALLPAASE